MWQISEGQWVKIHKGAVSSELLCAQDSRDLRAVWGSTRQQEYGGGRYIFNFLLLVRTVAAAIVCQLMQVKG